MNFSSLVAYRVFCGAALLDKLLPNWFNEIAVEELVMTHVDKCILGQLFGDYFVGRSYISRTIRSDFNRYDTSLMFGFVASFENEINDYSILQVAWKMEISWRLQKQALRQNRHLTLIK